MTNRERFLDSVGMIDEELLAAHFERKCPTRAQKIRRYVMAVGVYAAACLVLAAFIPFIIGKGELPAHTPGNAPVAGETIGTAETETYVDPPEPAELPTAVTVFEGCEFKIVLDKHSYSLGDTIYATVTLENKGEKDVGLWQGYLGDFLDEIEFYENGEVRWSYSSEWDYGYPEAIQCGPFEPGKSMTHTVQFTPGAPNDASDPVASMESLWEITASVQYYEYVEDYEGDVYEDVKTADVTIEVPHESAKSDTDTAESEEPKVTYSETSVSTIEPETSEPYEDTQPKPAPKPTSITVGIGGETFKVDKDLAQFGKLAKDCVSMVKGSDKVAYDADVSSISDARSDGIFVEFSFGNDFSVKRVFVKLDENYPVMWTAESPDYSGKVSSYTVDLSADFVLTVSDLVNGKDTISETVVTDGLEYTVILDRNTYTPGTPIKVTVILENKGTKTVTLRESLAKNVLGDMDMYVPFEFYNITPEKNRQDNDVAVVTFKPGDILIYNDWFDTEYFYSYGTWEFRSRVFYYEGIVEKYDNNLKLYRGEITIDVPHDSGEEIIEYPAPYISVETATSVTKNLYGCEYTLSIDKPKYEKGDTVTAKVSFVNKGKTTVYLRGLHMNHKLDYVSFKVNGKGSVIKGGIPEETVLTIPPGYSTSYTVKFDTSEAKAEGTWSILSEIEYSVYGSRYTESVEIEVPHNQ